MSRRVIRYSTVAALVLTLAILGFGFYLGRPFVVFRSVRSDYLLTTQGMSKTEVLSIMAANEHLRHSFGNDGRTVVWWDDQQREDEAQLKVVSTETYGVNTFMLPLVCEFSFDTDDRLIGRHIYD